MRNSEELDCSPIVLAREQPFRIGKTEFRPATREVLSAGVLSVIEPRVMQLLVALRRANGNIVSKVDLADLCWDGRIVGDDAIHRVVSRLRSIAEKQASGQFRIESIKKVGYRLVCEDGPKVVQSHGNRFRIGRRELLIGSGAVTIAGAAGMSWIALSRDKMPREARLLVDSARKSLREGEFGSAVNAIGTLRHATELAPKSAEAWGLLAFAFTVAATEASAQDRPDFLARGVAAMNRAITLEPFQADALAAQVRTIPMYKNWYVYEQACQAALRHHPDHPELLFELGILLAEVGRLRESLQLYERAMPSMPLSAELLTNRAHLLMSLGQLEEADAAIENAFDLLPQNYIVWTTKVYHLMYSGRPREAVAMFGDKDKRPTALSDENYILSIMMANAIAVDDQAVRRKAVDTLVRVAEEGKGFVMTGAIFAAFVGETDQAFRFLNALYFNRGFNLPSAYFDRANSGWGGERQTQFLFSREMTTVRRDSRFPALTRELGLDEYWRRTNSHSQLIV